MPSEPSRTALLQRYADLLDPAEGDSAMLDVVAELDALCAGIETPPAPALPALIANAEPTFTLDDVAPEDAGSATAPTPLVLDAARRPRHISAAPAARWRRLARQGRRLVAAGLVAALLLAFAAVLAQRTHDLRPGAGSTPTAGSATPSPSLVTPTAEPTVTEQPIRQVRVGPTATPDAPSTVTIEQEGGSDLTVINQQPCTSGMVTFIFITLVDFPTVTTSINFFWQHYDGATPLDGPNIPADAQFSQTPGQPGPVAPPGSSGPPPVRIQFWETWTLLPDDFSGSTARWGDQLVITAINGQTLATPITSHVLYYATGC